MKFCGHHNQQYANYLVECPICRGERMALENPPRKLQSINGKVVDVTGATPETTEQISQKNLAPNKRGVLNRHRPNPESNPNNQPPVLNKPPVKREVLNKDRKKQKTKPKQVGFF